MLKILQARLQYYVNQKRRDVQFCLRKDSWMRDQTVNTCWIIKKARDFQKNIYLCFIGDTNTFDHVDYNKLWKTQCYPLSSSHPHLDHTSLYSMPVSIFLPYKYAHQYHFSRFYIYALIFDTCFSLSDLLHSLQ